MQEQEQGRSKEQVSTKAASTKASLSTQRHPLNPSHSASAHGRDHASSLRRPKTTGEGPHAALFGIHPLKTQLRSFLWANDWWSEQRP